MFLFDITDKEYAGFVLSADVRWSTVLCDKDVYWIWLDCVEAHPWQLGAWKT